MITLRISPHLTVCSAATNLARWIQESRFQEGWLSCVFSW